MKDLKIQCPEGYEIDKERSTLDHVYLKEIEKPKYPQSVEEINRPYYINGYGDIAYNASVIPTKNHFSTEKRGREILALIQLLELRDAWNKIDEFNPDDDVDKFTITRYRNIITKLSFRSYRHLLEFKTEETRDLFLETFSDLIEEAKDLL